MQTLFATETKPNIKYLAPALLTAKRNDHSFTFPLNAFFGVKSESSSSVTEVT